MAPTSGRGRFTMPRTARPTAAASPCPAPTRPTSRAAWQSSARPRPGPAPTDGQSPRLLAEQHRPYLGIRHVDLARLLHTDVHAALYCWARAHRSEPALEMGKARERLSLTFEQPDPADAGHVGDRIGASKETAALQARVHHAINPVHLVAEAVKRVRHLLGRIAAEVVGLAGLGPEIGHLPEQPLVHRYTRALTSWIE